MKQRDGWLGLAWEENLDPVLKEQGLTRLDLHNLFLRMTEEFEDTWMREFSYRQKWSSVGESDVKYGTELAYVDKEDISRTAKQL